MYRTNSNYSRVSTLFVELKSRKKMREVPGSSPGLRHSSFLVFGGEEGGKILPYCSRGNRRLRMACARIDARSDSRVYQLLYTSFRSSTRSSSWAPCVYSEPRSTLSDLVKRSCCTFSWEMRAGRATRESCGPCEVN